MYVLNSILEKKMGDRGKLLVKLALDKNVEGDIWRKVELGGKCSESIANCSGNIGNDLESKHWRFLRCSCFCSKIIFWYKVIVIHYSSSIRDT